MVGLNFDFLSLNVVGFTLYSLYNCGLFWIESVQVILLGLFHAQNFIIRWQWLPKHRPITNLIWFQELYFDKNDTQLIPVKVNDVVFGLHAVFACIVTIIQCFIYEVKSISDVFTFWSKLEWRIRYWVNSYSKKIFF